MITFKSLLGRYLTRELISQSSIKTLIYISLIVKSHLNPFLEPTSTNPSCPRKQQEPLNVVRTRD